MGVSHPTLSILVRCAKGARLDAKLQALKFSFFAKPQLLLSFGEL